MLISQVVDDAGSALAGEQRTIVTLRQMAVLAKLVLVVAICCQLRAVLIDRRWLNL